MTGTKKDPFAEVELFRTGAYGARGSYTEKDLKEIAERANSENWDIPITVDHKQDGPAMGWVEKVIAKGCSLWGSLKPHAEFARMVKDGVFKTRSVEIYPGREPRLRAVTFLGAKSPQVKGMASIFSDNPEGLVSFAEDMPEHVCFDMDDEDAMDCFQETKREKGIDFPPRAFLHVPDVNAPSTWKLRVWENLEKKVTRRQLGLAAAAFSPGGFRGRRVQLPAAQVRPIKRRLKALYKSLGVPDEQVPAQIRNFSEEKSEIDGKCFFQEHFADAGQTIRLYSDPDGDPDPKLLGQAISCFSPGGFGAEQYRITPDTAMYMDVKANVVDACAIISKDPAWADWQDSDIFWDSQITEKSLRTARPDLYTTSTIEGTKSKEEDIKMSEELKELQVKFAAQEVELKEANEATNAATAKNEEITTQYSETKEKLETLERDQAMAAMQEDLKARVAKSELPELFATDVIAQFSNAENLDGLDERIEKNKELAAFNAPENPVEGNGAGEAASSESGLVAQVNELAKSEGSSFRNALIKVSKKQ